MSSSEQSGPPPSGVPIGKWVLANGRTEIVGGNEQPVPRAQRRYAGRFNSNNDTLAVTDANGNVFVTHRTERVVAAVERMGYTIHRDMPVPFSNGGTRDPAIEQPFDEAFVHSQMANRHLEVPRAGTWVQVSGRRFGPEGKAETMPRAAEQYHGTYSTNDDFIAIVDDFGEIYVAGNSPENVARAEAAGYFDGRSDAGPSMPIPIEAFNEQDPEFNLELMRAALEGAGPSGPLGQQAAGVFEGRVIGPPSGVWIRMDGQKERQFTGLEIDVPPAGVATRGYMESNNGVLVVHDFDGAVYVTGASALTTEAAVRAGYSERQPPYVGAKRPPDMGVPLSNGIPVDEGRAAAFAYSLKLADASRREGFAANLAERFEKATERPVSSSPPGKVWARVDGEEYTNLDGSHGHVLTSDERHDIALANTGHFESNNGVIALVDGHGRTWVALASPESRADVARLNYQQSRMTVPFSNGEVAHNPQVRACLNGAGQFNPSRSSAELA